MYYSTSSPIRANRDFMLPRQTTPRKSHKKLDKQLVIITQTFTSIKWKVEKIAFLLKY